MPRRNVYLETFGCQMNELDSELVSGQLRALGYRFVREASEAGIVLYNTCSVRDHAEQKVWSRLGELAIRKEAEPGLVVGVLGCLAERDGSALIRRMPVVDVLCGPGELDKLPSLIDNAVRTRESLRADDAPDDLPMHRRSARQVALQGGASRRSSTLAAAGDNLEMLDLSRSISPIDADGEGEVRRSAYVRITRGCNKFCTYCVVPHTRGAEIHRPPEHIVEECKRLADAGVVEITLLGQTVNHYRFEHGAAVSVNGVVQPQKGRAWSGANGHADAGGTRVTSFADLLRRVHDEVPAIQRLRFVTSYPRDFGDDALRAMRESPRICRYLHVPAQSGSDRILKLMNRGYSVAEYLEFLDRARQILDQPEIGRPLMLAGDFIVGFPTETDEDFAATMELARKARYKNSFIFKYSPRPGTTAFDRLEDDVPEAVKRRRNNELLALQTEMSDAVSREQVGRSMPVFVEGLSRREEKRARATARAQQPVGGVSLTIGGVEIGEASGTACATEACACDDGSVLEAGEGGAVQLAGRTDGDLIVFFDAPNPSALVGSIVNVRVTRAEKLSLFGEIV